MTRRHLFAALAAPLAGAAPQSAGGRLVLNARRRTAAGPVIERLVWLARRTVAIVCDMWDDHYCVSAARRVGEMIPRMNETLAAARRLGVHVVHAPSDTMNFYRDDPRRRRMQALARVEPPVPIADWCYLDRNDEGELPIADDEPCDDAVPRARIRMYSRQHPDLVIQPEDGISSYGQEIFNYCAANGVEHVLMMGVHANKCVLGRSFGIRQQVRLGMKVALVRDLTDAMYDPRDPPFVSHERGTELVIEHIERYWAPSVLSEDILRSASVATD